MSLKNDSNDRPKPTYSISFITTGLFKTLLRDKKGDANIKMKNKFTPLHMFCGWYKKDNLIDIVRLLIDHGADVNAKTKNGKTSLHLLRQNYQNDNLEDIVHLLTRKGADIS